MQKNAFYVVGTVGIGSAWLMVAPSKIFGEIVIDSG